MKASSGERLRLMHQRDWLSVIGLAALSCSGMVFGIIAILAATQNLWPVAVGLMLLGVAQIVIVFVLQSRLHTLSEDFNEMVRERRAVEQEYYVNFVQSESFNTEIGSLKHRTTKLEQDFQKSAAEREAQFKDLEQRLAAAAANPPPAPYLESTRFGGFATGIVPPAPYFNEQRPPLFDSPAAPPPYMPRADFRAPPPPATGQPPFAGLANIFGKEGIKPEPKVPRDQLTFLLEPIIDLATNETEHYRARYAMATTTGAEITFDRLVSNADRSGLRPSLDMHVINQALPLLKKLRGKHPNLKLFVPIGVPTLTSEATLRKIFEIVEEAGEAASGLVFELEHDSLGRLNENGITGLAMLARRGVAMALVNVSVAGLDLNSLRHLGVKFIGVDAQSVDSGYGVSPSWQEFVQVARGLQFQIVLLDVITSQQAASASQVARFAAGQFFAPPRRVRANGSGDAASAMSAAA